jgi:hypothetical protein
MPFKSKAQMRACYAAHDRKWNCHKWAHETPNLKSLPERGSRSHHVAVNTPINRARKKRHFVT